MASRRAGSDGSIGAMENALGRYPVSIVIPVAWGEMDAMQHVNNVVYLRWFESARIAYFERSGLQSGLDDLSVGPILARSTVDYIPPVTYPDTVRVEISVTKLGRSSFEMSYRLWSEALQKVAAKGDAVIVNYDYQAGKSVPLDDRIRGAIHALEASAPARPA